MWTRALLKENAKTSLKHCYWMAFLVCLITSLLTGGSNSGASFELDISNVKDLEHVLHYFTNPRVLLALAMAALTGAVFSVLLRILIGNVLIVGRSRFFLDSRRQGSAASLGTILYSFTSDYGKQVLTMFLRDLFVFLWSLLFVIPGIVKSLEYAMIPYILADDANVTREEAFAISRRLMDGHKWEFFVLQLSFLGWEILGALCCGIGVFFVMPYCEATYTEFYVALKETTPM